MGVMGEGSKLVGLIGGSDHHHASTNSDLYHGPACYQKLDEGTNMSLDSNLDPIVSLDNSSIGSNNSHTLLRHQALRAISTDDDLLSAVHTPHHHQTRTTGDDLARALMDPRHPTEGLPDYDEWTLDLRRLSLGAPFAQGAFGKLYRGIYNGEDVAVKLLERCPEGAPHLMVMGQQFVQEVVMLATLRHPNVVRFLGACTKPAVWCIVTEYARGGSVRQSLARRRGRPAPLRRAVKQALDVARGMAYVHALGYIHRDLKSDNLLISADNSIKIADFGVARIEVQTQGMTPETGTYRWMAP